MTRVVVTGATGFLGFHLVRQLLAQDYHVVALGRNRQAGERLQAMGAEFRAKDLTTLQPDRCADEIGSADGFIHAAALSSAWGSFDDFFRTNVTGTANAVQIATLLKASRFVFLSSPSLLFRFRDQFDLSETEPLPPPVNAYARTKRMAEEIVIRNSAMSTIVLRPRGLYGPGDNALLPRLMRAAEAGPLPLLRGGRACTNLTFVEDAAAATIMALHAPLSLGGRIYHIANTEILPITQIIEETARYAKLGVSWKRTPWVAARAAVMLNELINNRRAGRPEPRITLYGLGTLAFSQTLDCAEAGRDLGFHPKISFEQGLKRTFETMDGPNA